MNNSGLIPYVKGCNKTLEKSFRKAGNGDIEKAIHELRVEIKKIRFAIHYAHHCNHQVAEKILSKPYKKIFKKAGLIRDLQMKLNMTEKHLSKSAAVNSEDSLRKTAKKLVKKFRSHLPYYLKSIKKGNRNVLKALKKIESMPGSRYAGSLIKRMKYWFGKIEKQRLHESRKTLKHVLYGVQMLPGLKAPLSKKINLDACERLQSAIGDWHDGVLFQQWLTANPLQKVPGLHEKIRAAIASDYKKIKREINLLWKASTKALLLSILSKFVTGFGATC